MGCFHCLAIRNNAVYGHLCMSFMWTYILPLPACLLRNSSLFNHLYFLKWLHHPTFSPTVDEGSSYSPFLSTLTIICIFFILSLLSGCKVLSHCGSDLQFSDSYAVYHLSMGSLGICVSPLKECLFRSFMKGFALYDLLKYNFDA